jgi:hypothetical protein
VGPRCQAHACDAGLLGPREGEGEGRARERGGEWLGPEAVQPRGGVFLFFLFLFLISILYLYFFLSLFF